MGKLSVWHRLILFTSVDYGGRTWMVHSFQYDYRCILFSISSSQIIDVCIARPDRRECLGPTMYRRLFSTAKEYFLWQVDSLTLEGMADGYIIEKPYQSTYITRTGKNLISIERKLNWLTIFSETQSGNEFLEQLKSQGRFSSQSIAWHSNNHCYLHR
jgi:predicted DNA-binding protein YlxM (UPF0122 family)